MLKKLDSGQFTQQVKEVLLLDLQQLCRSIRSHAREWTLNERKVDMLQATTDVNLSSGVPVPPLAHFLSDLMQISQVYFESYFCYPSYTSVVDISSSTLVVIGQ